MKGDISLDSLADMLSPDLTEKIVSEKELKDRNIVSEDTLEFTRKEYGETKEFCFEQIITIYLLDKMFKSGK